MLRTNPRRQAERAEAVTVRRIAEKAGRRAALMETVGRMASMGPAATTAAPKTEAHRNCALLDMAEGRQCLLCVPGICCGGHTVACHSNLSIHGKAGARKADDHYSAWGCSTCHRWLDQGPAPAGAKLRIFMAAHIRQVEQWRAIAADMTEPVRLQMAAHWALDLLNATPTFDLENSP